MGKIISFNFKHESKSRNQLESYITTFVKKYERIKLYLINASIGYEVKLISDLGDFTLEPAIEGLKNDHFILGPSSSFELHRTRKLLGIEDLRELIKRTVKAQVKNFNINRYFYNQSHQVYGNQIIESFLGTKDLVEFSVKYLSNLSLEKIEGEEDVRNVLTRKGLRHNAWINFLPLLRGYFRVNYINEQDVNQGMNTISAKLSMLKSEELKMDVNQSKIDSMIDILEKTMDILWGAD